MLEALTGIVQDYRFNRQFPGYKGAIKLLRQTMPDDTKDARKILSEFGTKYVHNTYGSVFSNQPILACLGKSKSSGQLEQICSTINQIITSLPAEARSTALNYRNLDTCVSQAIETRKLFGDFSVSSTFTPAEFVQCKGIQTIEYGGSGCNAYSSEEIEVDTSYWTNPCLTIAIMPATK